MIITTLYDHGQTVYLKNETEQNQFIVGDIQILGGRIVKYQLSHGKYSGWHDECEMSDELNLTIKFSQE